MKQTVKSTLIAFVCIGFLGLAQAEDVKKKEDHSTHHPEGQTTETKTDKGEMGMMGKMDMHAMMGNCMKMHKDGKMCDNEMMGQCQKQMSKGECMKIIKATKAESKKTEK